ncbi:MAG: hypothetical protein SPK35_11095, partial [Prevotella sp.]|nr:hypothetical protein [Prevotella sp.]
SYSNVTLFFCLFDKPLFTQCFARADAKLCVGTCNALRWHMQSFAWTVAMLCVWDGKNWLIEIVDFW